MSAMLRVAAALVALASSATAAQAQVPTFTPKGVAVSMTASNPTITYGAATITCPTGTLVGTVDGFQGKYIEANASFSSGCNIGGLSATATCPTPLPGVKIHPFGAAATTATFALTGLFDCRFSVSGVCEIRIEAPQPTNIVTLDESATTLTATLSFLNAIRFGSALCGPASSTTASWTASYTVTPSTLAIT